MTDCRAQRHRSTCVYIETWPHGQDLPGNFLGYRDGRWGTLGQSANEMSKLAVQQMKENTRSRLKLHAANIQNFDTI